MKHAKHHFVQWKNRQNMTVIKRTVPARAGMTFGCSKRNAAAAGEPAAAG
jgi:hypothetical protein